MGNVFCILFAFQIIIVGSTLHCTFAYSFSFLVLTLLLVDAALQFFGFIRANAY